MIPVKQTVFGKRGNCMNACLASLFEVSLDSIPDFYDDDIDDHDAWWKNLRAWLATRGYGLMCVSLAKENLTAYAGYLIVSGMSSRGVQHATLWRDGHLAHDPHPDNSGILTVDSVDLLYPLFADES